jgi:hypothetical protein
MIRPLFIFSRSAGGDNPEDIAAPCVNHRNQLPVEHSNGHPSELTTFIGWPLRASALKEWDQVFEIDRSFP